MPVAILDTNAISDLMRNHPPILAHLASFTEPLHTSVVVLGEIRYGLCRLPLGKKRTDLEARAHRILTPIPVEPITETISNEYGRLKASLESQGINLDDNDAWIAATAIANSYLLVTRDQLFKRVPGLQSEDWSI